MRRIRRPAAGLEALKDSQEEAPSSRRLHILLSEGSSTSARETVYALGDRHDVDILDPSPWCQCRFSRLVRRWHRCPSYSRDPLAYLAFLGERLRRDRYDALVATHEQVFLLARVQQELATLVGVALPDAAAVDRIGGKATFVRLLDELGIPYPPTTIVRTRDELSRAASFPCFVKLAFSTAGQGVRYVETRRQFDEHLDRLEAAGILDGRTEILVQQPAAGRQRDALGIFQHGRLVASHCGQLCVRGVGGAAMARESVSDAAAVEHLAQLGEHLRWHGAMALDYFRDPETGRHEYIECNPRIGETFNATLCGNNLCEQLVRVSRGEEVETRPPSPPGFRSHQGMLVLTGAAINGANRRMLLKELWWAFRKKEHYAGSHDELTRPRDDWPSVLPYMGVVSLVTLLPQAGNWIVRRTVDNYSLPEEAASRIRELPQSELRQALLTG